MSILIHGMEMPKNCSECAFIHSSWGLDYYCAVAKEYEESNFIYSQRMSSCPLTELPPHGRLGDLDALQKQVENTIQDAHMSLLWKQGMMYAHGLVEASKTVIEAEGSEE